MSDYNPIDVLNSPAVANFDLGTASLPGIKQQQLLATSEAKKKALDPTYQSQDFSVLDGDTVKLNPTGDKIRLDFGVPNTSLDTFETRKDFTSNLSGEDKLRFEAKMLKQREAIAKDSNLPLDYIPNEAVYRRGEQGKDALSKLLGSQDAISIAAQNTKDKDNRTIANLTMPGSDNSLISPLNTPELNASYNSKFNAAKQGEDSLRELLRRDEATKYSVGDGALSTPVGSVINAVAGAATTATNLASSVLKSPFGAFNFAATQGITPEQRNVFKSLKIGEEASKISGVPYTPNKDEQEILQRKPGELASAYDRMQLADGVQTQIIDRANRTQEMFSSLYNSKESDKLVKDAKSLYKDSIAPTFSEGIDRYQQGDKLGGSLQVAAALANAGAGIFRVAINNPQAVAEEVVKQIPNSILASKYATTMFFGLFTENSARARDEFVKEHGRLPEGKEVPRLLIENAASAALDTVADKALITKPGVKRAFVREGTTESAQSVLEQDSVKQDLTKVDYADVFASGVVGALSGAGTTAVTQPKSALSEATNDIKGVAKVASNAISSVVPESAKTRLQDATQVASGVADTVKQSVTTAVNEVVSATSIPTVDPVQQVSGQQDHVKALQTLLRPENIAVATTTKESSKAFIQEASNRQGKLLSEIGTLTDEATKESLTRAKELSKELLSNKRVIDGLLVKHNTDFEPSVNVDEDVKLAIAEDVVDQPATLQAVERTIRSIRQPGKVSEAQAETLLKSKHLTAPQQEVVKAFIATRKALSKMSDVSIAVLEGKDDFIGLSEHQGMVADFLDQGNIPVASNALEGFRAFTNSQQNKASTLTAIKEAITSGDTTELANLTKQFIKNFPTSKELKIGDTPMLSILNKGAVPSEADLTRFTNLTDTVNKEANLLKLAFTESELHFKQATQQRTQPTQESNATQDQEVIKTQENQPNNAQVVEVQPAESIVPGEKTAPAEVVAEQDVIATNNAKDLLSEDEIQAYINSLNTEELAVVSDVAAEPAKPSTVSDTLKETQPPVDSISTPKESTTSSDVITEHADEVAIADAAIAEEVDEVVVPEKLSKLEQIKSLAKSKVIGTKVNLRAMVSRIVEQDSLAGISPSMVETIIDRLHKSKDRFEVTLDVNKPFTGDATSLGLRSLTNSKEINGKSLSTYYSAKKLNPKNTYSVLQTIPNFFSTLRKENFRKYLGLSDNQYQSLATLDLFITSFAKTFKTDTFNADRLEYADTISKNPALYFMKEDGSFDEDFLSTLGVVSYAWVANNANDIIEHDDAGINGLLGRDSKHPVTEKERDLLYNKGILKSTLISSLGKEIFSGLGLQFNPTEDGSVESKMIEALGIYAVVTLEHRGILARTEGVNGEVFGKMQKGESVSDELYAAKSNGRDTLFVNIVTQEEASADKRFVNTKPSKEIISIVDNIRNSEGLLGELFGLSRQKDMPLTEAPKLAKVPKFVKRGLKKIPERMRKALHKYASNGYTINLDNHSVMDFLEDSQQLDILDYDATMEGVHVTKIKSVQGLNRTILNEWDTYQQLTKHLNSKPGGLSAPMYFMSSVWQSGRAGIEGLINPQSSKFHRHMLGMGSWKSTIDSEDKRKQFKIAVAEALGSKLVGKNTDDKILEDFEALVNQTEILNGIKAIKRVQTGNSMSASEKLTTQQDIVAAIKKGGHKTHSLEALTSMVNYSATEPFTTRITREVDGVTNGIIIGLIQLMGAAPDKIKDLLESGGLFTDANKVYGDFISKIGSVDNYQRMAHSLLVRKKSFFNEVANLSDPTITKAAKSPLVKKFTEDLKGNLDTLASIDFFVGNLEEGDQLTKAARDLAKNPLMITSYGAALKKVIDGLSSKILDNLYSKLEASRNNDEELKVIADHLTNMLKPDKAFTITSKNALTFKMSTLTRNNQEQRFKDLVNVYVGEAMGGAIDEHFGEFIKKRTESNDAMNLVHAAFIVKYDAAYTDARNTKGSNLTNSEIDALVKKLEPSMASFEHALSDGNVDTELLVTTTDSERQIKDESFRVQVNVKKPLAHGPKSASAHGSVKVFAMPGVGSVIKAIHSSDGAVQYKIMETSSVLNIHDADLSGIDGVMGMAFRQNQAFKEVMEDYSVREAIQKSLVRSVEALTEDELVKVNEILKDSNEKSKTFLGHSFFDTEYTKGKKTVKPKYKSVKDFVDQFADTTARDLKAKKELVQSIMSWGQYHTNHGAYVVNGSLTETTDSIIKAVEAMEESPEKEKETIEALVSENFSDMKNTLKSSATAHIDTSTFVADMSQVVSADTVESIFDQLGKEGNVTDSVKHTEHLRGLLTTTIKGVLNPLEVMVRRLGQENNGVLEQGKVYLNVGNNNRLYTTDQSVQEVYAHELTHAVTVAGLTTNYWLRKKVNKLYNQVREQITFNKFLDKDSSGNVIVPSGSTLSETEDKAQAVYDHIFNNNDFTTVHYKNPITNRIVTNQLSNGLFEFVAMGTTNAKFIEILKGIDTNKAKKIPTTMSDKVFAVFAEILDSVLNLINKTKDHSANAALMTLTHKLARTNQAKSSWIARKIEENAHLEEFLNSKLYKTITYSALGSSKLLKKTGNQALSSIGDIIGLGPSVDFVAYKKVAGKLTRKLKITKDSFAYQLFNEVEGTTKINANYHRLLAASNKFIDQFRREMATSLSNQLMESFVAGKPSKSERNAITKVLIKTDMSFLLDNGYSWDTLLGLLKYSKKLTQEIKTIQAALQTAAPNNYAYYNTQAASLGHMMVNGQPLKWGTKTNAVNIAHLGETGKTVEGDLIAIEKHLDTLASLFAIQESNPGHISDFVTVTEREFAKDKENNGVLLAYFATKDLKERALVESFEGQKELMRKGYVKEIYNPRITVLSAPTSMEAELKAQGYVIQDRDLVKDPSDLNKVPVSLYVNKDGDTATFMKMIVSLTAYKRSGTDLTAGYSSIGEMNPALLGAFDTAHATKVGQTIIDSADYNDLSKRDLHNLLVPVENTNHEIVGYRYMMSESTKDNLLEKDNSFDKVLGAMEGSIVDKRESIRINREAVKLMFEDFNVNYAKDPDLFIKFGPTSSDKKDREIYRLLPDDMRNEIQKLWGSDTMFVRESVFRVIFGFRKFSITERDEKVDPFAQTNETVLAKFGSSLRDKLRSPTSKKIEIGLQEIAKEVKDAIVIKSGSTLYNNVISNNWLLWVNGLNRAEIIKDQAIALDAARQYQKDLAQLRELERSVRINPNLKGRANVEARINRIKDDLAVNPVAFLIDSGVFQTIIEDIDPDESQYTYKGMLETKVSPLVEKMPAPLRSLGNFAYMSHNTKLYKFLREATQLSDFVARYALHKHNIEKKGMTAAESIDNINEVFINYDLPTSRSIQYANDMNFAMFTKFFIRSQKIIAQTFTKAPARALGLLGVQDVLGEFSTIDDSNIITSSLIGKLGNPLGLVDEVANLHTINALNPSTYVGTYNPN